MAVIEEVTLRASEFEYDRVAIADMIVDRRVQRAAPDEKRIAKMLGAFDPDGLGTLTLSKRPNGQRVILDGQHRWEVCQRQGYAEALNCKVFVDLWRDGEIEGLRREALIFDLLNDHLRVNSPDGFRMAVLAGRTDACRLAVVLEKLDIKPATGFAPGNFGAIATAMAIIRRRGGEEHLTRAFTILLDAWSGVPKNLDGRLVGGLVMFLNRYDGEANDKTLTQELRGLGPGGPASVLTRGYSIRANLDPGPVANAVGQAFAAVYNGGVRSAAKKLSSWRAAPLPADEPVGVEPAFSGAAGSGGRG